MSEGITVLGEMIRYNGDDVARLSPTVTASVKEDFLNELEDSGVKWDPNYVRIHRHNTVEVFMDRLRQDKETAGLFTAEEVGDMLKEYLEEVKDHA